MITACLISGSLSHSDASLPPATKLGQSYVFTGVCDSVHRGGLPQCMLGYHPPPTSRHPPSRHPPRSRPLPEQTHTPEQTPPWEQTHTSPGADTPPRRACWEIRSTRGRYASYWNAILLNQIKFTITLVLPYMSNRCRYILSTRSSDSVGSCLVISCSMVVCSELFLQTRMHSSRMRTARNSSSPGSLHQTPPRAGTPCHRHRPEQAPPLGADPPGPDLPGPGTPPSRYPPGPGPPPVNKITDTCKNITFPQLRLRAVIRPSFNHALHLFPSGLVLPNDTMLDRATF